jgi:ribosomal protein L3
MKLGMTIMYDKWGNIVPVTIVLLDRVQVVQIKNP